MYFYKNAIVDSVIGMIVFHQLCHIIPQHPSHALLKEVDAV